MWSKGNEQDAVLVRKGSNPRQSEQSKLSSTLSTTIRLFPSSQLSSKNKHRYIKSDASCSTEPGTAYSQATCPRFTGLDHWILDNMVEENTQKIVAFTLPTGNKQLYREILYLKNSFFLFTDTMNEALFSLNCLLNEFILQITFLQLVYTWLIIHVSEIHIHWTVL